MSGTLDSSAAGLRRLGRGIAGDAILVSVLAAAVKIAGALKVVTMARAYGAGDALDSFLAAFLVPSLVADTLAKEGIGVDRQGRGAPRVLRDDDLGTAFVALREASGVDAAEKMYQAVVGWVLSALAGFALLLAVGSPLVVALIASGFDPPKRAVTLDLLLLLLPLLPLGGLSVAYRARLNSSGQFAVAALAPAAVPAFTINAIFLFGPAWGVYAIAWGTIAGGVVEVAVLASDVGLSRRVLGDARLALGELLARAGRPDVLVVDPPRAGLSKKVVHRIIDCAPKRIVYVSCNPTTLAPNAAELVQAGWILRKVRPVDMFPQTHHIEAVAVFERG